jgi:hypothetical protein
VRRKNATSLAVTRYSSCDKARPPDGADWVEIPKEKINQISRQIIL